MDRHPPRDLDPLDALKADHDTIRSILSTLVGVGKAQRRSLLGQLETEVLLHARLAREVVYAALHERLLDGNGPTAALKRSVQEHALAEARLAELKALGVDSPAFEAKAQALAELIQQHADAEEAGMFPQLRDHLSEENLHHIGRQAAEARQGMDDGGRMEHGPTPELT